MTLFFMEDARRGGFLNIITIKHIVREIIVKTG